MTIDPQRLTVSPDRSFVVFLIGARVNKWWLLPVVWAVASAMRRMMKRLTTDPDSGLLAFEAWPGRTTVMLQYWRSMDDLLRYAKDKQEEHVPAWRKWIRSWGPKGAVGIWHETYEIQPGRYEVFYQHMPEFGLGKVVPRIPAAGPLKTASGRLATGAASLEPPSAVA